MKTKSCDLCNTNITIAYRVKIQPGKIRIFVCGKCCLKSKEGEYYRYGGTWKSKEKRKGQK